MQLFVLSTITVDSTICAANWRETHWGMTIEDARQLYPRAVQRYSGKIFGSLDTLQRIDDFEFELWLTFTDGGLTAVHLTLQPASDCEKLRRWAVDKYSSPFRTQEIVGGFSHQWLAQDDLITLIYEPKTNQHDETCLLSYNLAPATIPQPRQ